MRRTLRLKATNKLSRARIANILRVLRVNDFVAIEISEENLRQTALRLTDKGSDFLADKYSFLTKYFEQYVEVLGDRDIESLTELLKKTVDNEMLLSADKFPV